MNVSWSLFAMVSLLMVSLTASQQSGVMTRGSSGIQIGGSDRRAQAKDLGFGRGGGVRLGEGRFPNSTRQRPYTTTTTTTTTTPLPERITHASNAPAGSSNNITYLEGDSLVRGLISSSRRSSLPQRQGPIQPVSSALQSRQMLEVGMVVPHKSFGVREYTKAVTVAVNTLHKTTKRGRKLKLFERYDIHVKVAMQELTPSPTESHRKSRSHRSKSTRRCGHRQDYKRSPSRNKYVTHDNNENYGHEDRSNRESRSSSFSFDDENGNSNSVSFGDEVVGEETLRVDSPKSFGQAATSISNTATAVPAVPTEQLAMLATTERALESEVLQVMGDRLMPDRVLARAIYRDLAIRIKEVVQLGLPSEERKILLKKFSPAENCLFIDPPKLNLEVKASLQDVVVKRDSRIIDKRSE